MRGERIDERENRIEERRMVEVEERKPVRERLGKIEVTYRTMENDRSPKGGIGNKAKRFDFQNAEERQEDDAPDGEAGARGGLTADEFRFTKPGDDEEEDFA